MKLKKLIFSFTLLLALAGAANAQRCQAMFVRWPFSPAAGDTIQFADSSFNTSSGTSFYWTFGDGSTASVANPLHYYTSAGVYNVCLTISDSSIGCSSTYCDSIVVSGTGGGSSCNANFRSYVSSTTRQATFYNLSSGSGSHTYTWNYGDGTSSVTSFTGVHTHTYSSPGTYLVWLVQRGTSCVDSIADTVVVDSTSRPCQASFYMVRDSMDTCKYYFTSTSTGTSFGTYYSWSFGDGSYGYGSSATHTYTTTGWVAVTLSIGDSSRMCSSSYTDSFYVTACKTTGNKCTLSVFGQILTGSSFAQDATVYLIEKRGNNLFAIDTTSVDSIGNYYFGRVCPGTYYVKSALRTGDPNYTDYIPTYYGDELRWSNATTLGLTSNQFGVDIQMVRGTNPGGKGFIGGNVRKGANKKEGDPLSGVQLVVFNSSLDAVAYVYSDGQGKFEFPSLPLGEYMLIAEIPGIQDAGYWVELTEEKPSVNDVVVTVNEEDIATGMPQQDISRAISVYPNPVSQEFRLNVPEFKGNLVVMDVTGRKLMTVNINEQAIVNIQDLPTGIYQLMIHGYQNGELVQGNTTLLKN